MFFFFSKVILWTNLAICLQRWDHNCRRVFQKKKLFSLLSSILFRNMCKLHRKLRNAKIYALQVGILHKKFLCHFIDNLGKFSQIGAHIIIIKKFLTLNFCFLHQAPWCLATCVNCVTNLIMPKIYPNSLGHDKINLDVHKASSASAEIHTL